MSISILVTYIISVSILLFFLYFAFVSFIENETKALSRALLLGFVLSFSFVLLNLISLQIGEILRWSAIALISIFSIILIAPIYPDKLKFKNQSPKGQIDERNVMFSRSELIPETKNFDDYYKNNPEHKKADDKFRSLPGLLSEKASKYEPYTFNVSNANFQTVENFKHNVTVPANSNKQAIDAHKMTKFIKKWMKKIGVIDIGVTELKAHHLYSHRGRNFNYSEKVKNKHKYAIALIVEMSEEMIKDAPNGATVMESSYQYLRAGNFAMQLASFIGQNGYEARSHIDGNYELVCPLVAKDAGLGELGRMGLLMTPKLGSRIRISVVTTDMPLITDKAKDFAWMTTFCEFCKKCADNCPANAISKKSPELISGIKRWQISQEKCFTYWAKVGTDCAKCITVCPFSHPNNFLHNFIRFFIAKSYLFAKFSLLMDDFFYGRKPKAKQAKWLKEFIK